MSSNRDRAFLLDIARAAQKVLQYKAGMDKATFFSDDKTQSAIVFQLLIMGEAVKRLSSELRSQNPEIPWSLIARMRDNLIHRYDDIDLDEVWKTSDKDIPALLNILNSLLPNE
ncbi:HepT-like ribonuclease domain-containing protein [Phormidesmis priestleyi]